MNMGSMLKTGFYSRFGMLRRSRRTLGGAYPRWLDDALATHGQSWKADAMDVYCPRCGSTSPSEAVTPRGCSVCVNIRLPWQRTIRLGTYEDPLALWIRQMKFHRVWPWANYFGEQLASRIPAPPTHLEPIVCPVPMHWRRRWMRGFNQAQLIAKTIGKQRKWPCISLIRRPRPGPPQTQVVMSQRKQNIRHAFRIASVDLSQSHVVLVDDVRTTGSTLRQCTNLLRTCGATSIVVAVVAVTRDSHRMMK